MWRRKTHKEQALSNRAKIIKRGLLKLDRAILSSIHRMRQNGQIEDRVPLYLYCPELLEEFGQVEQAIAKWNNLYSDILFSVEKEHGESSRMRIEIKFL